MLESLSLAAGLSWASGLRHRVRGRAVPASGAHPSARYARGAKLAVGNQCRGRAGGRRIPRCKIPAFDSLWDAIHTFIRIPAGAVLAAGSLGYADHAMLTIAALAGWDASGCVAFREGRHARAHQSVAGTSVELGGVRDRGCRRAGGHHALAVRAAARVSGRRGLGLAAPRARRRVAHGQTNVAYNSGMNRLRSKHD